ncbi:putative reverse transcriptase domain-containing protein [Tanacetum coccineum]|uniref:Reverse transcriptase domain-containing protein n=1 Tax=Tanacetum coccineum TaxID=301880 RepID=A0ABQ5FX79_9ASTR
MPSASSAVTYIYVYTDSKPGRAFWGADDEEISEGGIPWVIVLGYDGLSIQPAHDPDYVPEPIYPEYIPLEDEHEFSAEEQPLPPVDSPTAESPRYVTESDPEEDPEEYEDDETEDGPIGNPMDGGDDGDDDDGDSSRDDANDEDKDDEDEEEEDEENLAPTASAIVVPVDEPVLPSKGIEPVIPPPSTDITIGARITVRPQTSISLPPEAEALIDAVTAALPSPLLPPLPPSLYIPPPIDHRDEIPESKQPPCKRDTWVDPAEAVPEIALVTLGEVNTKVTELADLHEHDTQDLYALLEDAQDSRSRISQRIDIDSQRVDLLMGDRMTLQETIWMVEEEAYASREAWAHLIGLSQVTHHKIQTHRNHVYAHETHLQQAELAALRETNRRRQDQMVENLQVIKDMRREISDMQTELLSLREQQRRARQPGPEARIPDHQDASGDADTIELANDLMDQKLHTYAERSDNKRKADDSSRNNHGHQQQPFKKQNVAKVYNMGTSEKKTYGGNLPKCTKCHFHHNGSCTQKCHKYNKVGYFARDCRSSGNTNVANTQRGNGATPNGNGCFECGAAGHFKRDCPKLKNKDGGNRNAQGWVYAVRNVKKRGNAPGGPDSNVVTGTFLLNNYYASILFDTGADRSFISTAFSSLINIAPAPLENSYDVELVDGKIVRIDTIIRGCTLNFLDHPFNIDLMPGSFDVIICMD